MSLYKIIWKKKGDSGTFWCVVGTKIQADRFENHFKKDKEIEWVKVEDSTETAFRQFPKK